MSHENDWLYHCKQGTQPGANFDYSCPLTEMILLGNVAKKVDGPLDYDDKAMRFTNNDKATALLHKNYREGWSQ